MCVLVKLQERKTSNLGYKETLIPLSNEHLLLRNRDFTKMFANKKFEKRRGWEGGGKTLFNHSHLKV